MTLIGLLQSLAETAGTLAIFQGPQPPVTTLEEFVIQIITVLFQTNNILSGLLVIVVVWGGRWFGRVAWPDIVGIWRQREEVRAHQVELQCEADMERVRREAENDALLIGQLSSFSDAFREVSGETRAIASILQSHTEMLVSIIRDFDGREQAHGAAAAEAKGAGSRG